MTAEDSLEQRYAALRARIEAARGSGPGGERGAAEVTLIAVSKTVAIEQIEALYRLGQRDFGENYVQELTSKAAALELKGCRDIRWHFIGHLQTNKAKVLVPVVHAIHSVDSLKLAQELAKRWSACGRPGRLPIFIEVNLDEEAGKSGVLAPEVGRLATQLAEIPELEPRGLMCVPRPRPESESAELRARFAHLRALEQGCRPVTRGQLSMGMSSDFEVALAEGATHVRVGTALFGARKRTD